MIGDGTGREIRSTSYSATVKSIGGAGGLRASEAVLSTDVLRGVEGLIGASKDDALFGNGATAEKQGTRTYGGDYIEAGAGAGDDRPGFGAAQNLQRVTRAPGAGSGNPSGPLNADTRAFLGSGGAIGPQNVNSEALLSQLDPEDATVGAARSMFSGVVNVGRNGFGGFEIGSFLSGGAGRHTLDLRFDRGLEFRSEANPPARRGGEPGRRRRRAGRRRHRGSHRLRPRRAP